MKDSVIKTLAYFDIFDYPLTREELFSWQWVGDNDCVRNYKEGIIDERQRLAPDLRKKMRVAVRGGRIIRFIPFVRAFFVCNQFNVSTKKESDIDTFIIIKKGRIWFARFLIILFFHLFNLRITKKQSRNKICLSFYVTDDNLDLSKIAIEQPDIYLTYWIEQLIPVYDSDNYLEKVRKNNSWIKKYLPNTQNGYKPLHLWSVHDNIITNLKRVFCEWLWGGSLGDSLEIKLKEIQMKKLKQKNIDMESTKKDIIISDTMLKFHENDRREFFREQWREKIQSIYE